MKAGSPLGLWYHCVERLAEIITCLLLGIMLILMFKYQGPV